ncbi:MAG: peptide deformylase [Bacteroides sp. SM23_62_1]|nr:MAG: peptide deformylase [Bacteroides sp. SM23_62_1]
MTYPIHVYGMPVLRKKAAEIKKDHEELNQLIDNMYETLYQADGIGLAAPQIGKSLRLIVVDGTTINNEEDPELKDFKKVFINPYITEEDGDEWEFNEGCLSLPNIREDVKRKSRIRLQYYDQDFNFHNEHLEGIRARILQHEVDHLNGILFIDKLQPLKKRLLNGKLREISKGKAEINYKIVYPKR